MRRQWSAGAIGIMVGLAAAMSVACTGAASGGGSLVATRDAPAAVSHEPRAAETSARSAAPVASAGTQQLCLGKGPTIVGTHGPDHLSGKRGQDVILALSGDDVIDGVHDDDLVCAGGGDDVLQANGWGVRANLGPGNDVLRNSRIVEVAGDFGNDRLVAHGAGKLRGGPGDDLIKAAHQHLRGYAENTPCVSYQFAHGPVHANLTIQRAWGEGRDRLVNLRCIQIGSRYGDLLIGSPNNDSLDTSTGRHDRVFARAGNDLVMSSRGGDYINLGPGNDSGYGGGVVIGGPGRDVWREQPID